MPHSAQETRTKIVDWNRIERERDCGWRESLLAPDATDEQIDFHNAAVEERKSRPGRHIPFSSGVGADGVRFRKTRFVQDCELTPNELKRVARFPVIKYATNGDSDEQLRNATEVAARQNHAHSATAAAKNAASEVATVDATADGGRGNRPDVALGEPGAKAALDTRTDPHIWNVTDAEIANSVRDVMIAPRGKLDAITATRGNSARREHPAKSTSKRATRGKSAKRKLSARAAEKLATRGKSVKPPVVEDVKASKGTWAFRLRWNSLPDRPVEYVRRVTDSVHALIREEKYEEFKEQLIRNYKGQSPV